MASEVMQAMIEGMKALKESGSFVYPEDGDFAPLRETINAMSEMNEVEEGVSFIAEVLNGVEVERAEPEELTSNLIIVHYHGGAFVTGTAKGSRTYAAELANELGCRIYAVSYRLAPEFPFPAAPDDCFAVYQALLENYPTSPIVLIGDSAGGALAISVGMDAWASGLRLPAAICLFSPLLTVAEKLPSRLANILTDPNVDPDINDVVQPYYFPDTDPRNPRLSPLYGDFSGLPALLVMADRDEILFDDARLAVDKARMAGVEVQEHFWEGTFHAFETSGKMVPEGAEALAETIAFINRYI